jgi:sugar/nucleoside kinase (ribokinase family)
MKFSVDISITSPQQLSQYAGICGWTLARAHARTGDAPMIYGYVGKSDTFDRAIGTFAELYAEQTERDCELFLDAIESGEIKAQMNA